jgi:ribosomal protein S18 acetylase RimI-like enzyme
MDLEVRTATTADVRGHVLDVDDREFFLDRLRAADGLALFAFLGAEMAGHIFVRLGPAAEAELREHLPGVPILEHLKVAEHHRGAGIGRHLIAVAENTLRDLGFARVALGVLPENVHAIRLYERLLFTAWREETLDTFQVHIDPDGTRTRRTESCRVYLKDLR